MELAFLENLLKKPEALDIEDFLNNIDMEEEVSYEDADAFVKPVVLNAQEDAQVVLNEAKAGNIVLVNIGDLSKRNAIKLKELITDIKVGIEQINGDIARVSDDKVIITPSKVKIIKRKEHR